MVSPIAIIPDNIPVAPGSNIKIPILLINGLNFGAIDIDLKYDPNILELPPSALSGNNTNINQGDVTNNFQIASKVDTEQGTVKIVLVLSNVNNITQGTGIIAELDFKVKDNLAINTTSVIDLTKVQLNENEVTINDGSIIVSDENPKSELVTTFFDASSDHVIDGNTTVNFTIFNQGIATSENFTVKIYYSENKNINPQDIPQEDTLITKSYPGLAVGQTISETLSISLSQETLLSSAKLNDPTGLGINHVSSSANYLGIIIDDQDNDSVKGVNLDDISYFPWDINQDKMVTPLDAMFVINNLGQTISDTNKKADINLDDQITIEDVNEIYGKFGYTINPTIFND